MYTHLIFSLEGPGILLFAVEFTGDHRELSLRSRVDLPTTFFFAFLKFFLFSDKNVLEKLFRKNILERKGKEFDVKKFERENFEKN